MNELQTALGPCLSREQKSCGVSMIAKVP